MSDKKDSGINVLRSIKVGGESMKWDNIVKHFSGLVHSDYEDWEFLPILYTYGGRTGFLAKALVKCSEYSTQYYLFCFYCLG